MAHSNVSDVESGISQMGSCKYFKKSTAEQIEIRLLVVFGYSLRNDNALTYSELDLLIFFRNVSQLRGLHGLYQVRKYSN